MLDKTVKHLQSTKIDIEILLNISKKISADTGVTTQSACVEKHFIAQILHS